MVNYFIRRLLLIIPTFLGCTLLVFCILQFTPGGPFERAMQQAQAQVQRGEGGGTSSGISGGNVEISEEAKQELRRYYNLDKPIPMRYLLWLGNVMEGDFGQSSVYGDPAFEVITSRFPVSIYFGLIGFVLSYLVCIPLGIIKAIKHGSPFDIVSSALVFIGYSIPGWALGALLLSTMAAHWHWFPLGNFRSENWDALSFGEQIWDQLNHSVLPLICYMIGGFATLTILMKNSLLENLGQDYVRTAFAKGLSERRVVFRHAMRNSLIPIATGIGGILSIVLTGSVLIETVFNIDGFGYLSYRSAVERDYTVVMGILVFTVVLRLLGNILSDFAYAIIDPRIRFD